MAGTPAYSVGVDVACFIPSTYVGDSGGRGVMIAGPFTAINEFNIRGIARLDASGFLDPSFNPGTGFSNSSAGGQSDVRAICDMGDGRIMVGGRFDSYNGTTTYHLIILNVDGTVDATFNPGPNMNGSTAITGSEVSDIVKRADGKFYVTGNFVFFGSHERHQIVCIDDTGAVDSSFDTSSGPGGLNGDPGEQTYHKLTLEKTVGPGAQRVLAVGDSVVGVGDQGIGLALYNLDGSEDTTFRDNTLLATTGDPSNYGAFRACATQSDGKYLIGGGFAFWVGDLARRRLVRIHADGTLDPSYNPLIGDTSNASVKSIGIQYGDYSVVVGEFTGVWGKYEKIRQNIARLGPTGEVEGPKHP